LDEPQALTPTAMHILGVSAFTTTVPLALLRDGEIVAAAQEERFTQRKHDPRLLASAIEYCLREGGVEITDVDHVVFYDEPLVKFERLFETSSATHRTAFVRSAPQCRSG
jgi:carbamoyltransferase